ncbi:hypothetical protein ACSBR1_041211 [Camellia fascicularis]
MQENHRQEFIRASQATHFSVDLVELQRLQGFGFEFVENGILENWLHPSLLEQYEPKILNFVQRLNIAIDVACALDYLHHHCEMAFIHCDLKPKQVMQIVDPQIILEMKKEASKTRQSSTTNISKLEACLVPVLEIGVSCSAEMPNLLKDSTVCGGEEEEEAMTATTGEGETGWRRVVARGPH